MDYLYDIEDFNDISDWFNDEDDVQNTELEEIDEDKFASNRCPVCERQLETNSEGNKFCDWCGYSEEN